MTVCNGKAGFGITRNYGIISVHRCLFNCINDLFSGSVFIQICEHVCPGALVLLASHNYEDICLLSDQVYRMENGRLREEGVG